MRNEEKREMIKALGALANELLDMRVKIAGLKTILQGALPAEDVQRIEIETDYIPKGAVLIEAYKTDDEIVIMHDLAFGELPPEHNCDEMGCGTLSHVWRRIPFERINQTRPPVT